MTGAVYMKGSPQGCDKEWYHGELSRVEAEQVLTASGCDCFLVRVSEGALILSLIHHGQLHHVNIKYSRGWYELGTGQAQYSFTGLEELVNHYRITIIGGLHVALKEVCEKTGMPSTNCDASRVHNNIPIYTKGNPEDLIKHSWYHGNITKEQAEAALRQSSDNGFLVRVSGDSLVLSKNVWGWRSHDVIQYSPRGYKLRGKSELFESILKMITYYKHHPIEESQVLGTAITKVPSVMELQDILTYEIINFRKEETTQKIQWKRSGSLPVAISAPQVVKIGDSVYVGGGMRENRKSSTIFKFDKTQNTWTALTPPPTFQHALTTLNNELIAIGGTVCNKAVSTVYTYRNEKWIKVLPPMLTPRYNLAATSHANKYIIAAGGKIMRQRNGESEATAKVEIYIEQYKTWYRTSPLPFSLSTFSMCTINETCYILGGTARKDQVKIVLFTTIFSLLESATTCTTAACRQHVLPWKRLPDEHPLCCSTPVELSGRLVTMGGSSHPMQRQGTRYIGTYDYTIGTWVECKNARLPVPLYRAGVVKLDSDQVMIVGGQPKMQQFSAAVFIGKCYKARQFLNRSQ